MRGEMILHESLKVAIIVRRLTMGFAEVSQLLAVDCQMQDSMQTKHCKGCHRITLKNNISEEGFWLEIAESNQVASVKPQRHTTMLFSCLHRSLECSSKLNKVVSTR